MGHLAESNYKPVSYQTTMGGLHDFYIVAATASSTLVGLLFVSLSLHLRIVISTPEVRSLARVTLANFGSVLFVSMFMVIAQDQPTAAYQLIGSGLVSLAVTAPSLFSSARSQRQRLLMDLGGRIRLLLRFGLSSVGYLTFIAAGVLLLSSRFSVFAQVMVWTIVILLLISLRNTWDLLITVEDVTLGREKNGG
jgi:hypothetical protein